MTDVWLGVIAAAVVVMAAVQIGVIVYAARTARRIESIAERLARDIQPGVISVQSVAADAARMSALAAAQADRASTWLDGLKSILSVLRDMKPPKGQRAGAEDDALFIG